MGFDDDNECQFLWLLPGAAAQSLKQSTAWTTTVLVYHLII